MLYKKWIPICCLFCLALLLQASAKKTQLTGKIIGFKGEEISLGYQAYSLMSKQEHSTSSLASDGSFSFELDLTGPVRAFILLGSTPVAEAFVLQRGDGRDTSITSKTNRPHILYFYLSPGDKQQLKVDLADLQGSLQLMGKGSANSLYMNQEDWRFNQYKDKHLKNYFGYVHYEPAQYLEYVQQRASARTLFLQEFAQQHKLSKHFIQVNQNTIYGDAVMAKLSYPKMRASYRNESYTPPEGYYDFMESVNFDESKAEKGIAYFYFLDYYLKEDLRLGNTSLDLFDFAATKLQGYARYEYYAYALGSHFKRKLYNQFDANCPYPGLAKQVKLNYQHMEGMLDGNPAPAVVFQDLEGKEFSWSDWTGKYVYVDFWATWCGPCIQEMPALDSLQKDYADQPIAFVSVSFDKESAKQKWKDFVVEKPLHGIQLWADASNNKKIATALNILQIPRFLLLDPQGNIVDANAPRPSDKRIRMLLDGLLKAGK